MKVLVIGAGRMGMRHVAGVAELSAINKIVIVDIDTEALSSAKEQIIEKGEDLSRYEFVHADDLADHPLECEIGIIASTANNRKAVLDLAINKGCRKLLVEKPLGQNLQEVEELSNYVKEKGVDAFVNLNMRMYEDFVRLKNDLQLFPQMQGPKIITLNTGTLGISANGIHYLDFLYFILDADRAEIVAGEVENETVPSGRGPQFGDYGGWCTIKLYNNEKYLGRAQLSISATSTVFGGWDIVGPHGRIRVNEIEQQRVDILRKPDSDLPMYRYAGDYEPPVVSQFTSPFLGDLTRDWLNELLKGNNLLPTLDESLKVHQLMFNWINLKSNSDTSFIIT